MNIFHAPNDRELLDLYTRLSKATQWELRTRYKDHKFHADWLEDRHQEHKDLTPLERAEFAYHMHVIDYIDLLLDDDNLTPHNLWH